MTRVVLLVGTRRGLFRATSDAERSRWNLEGPFVEGHEIYHACFDPRDGGAAYCAANHIVWGSHVYRSPDHGLSWTALEGRPAFPTEAEREVAAIWHLAPGHANEPGVLYAGIEPAALFVSSDRGETWQWNAALDEHPTRGTWQPAKGGLALHSIQIDPDDPATIYLALSAGGCYRSRDAGASWTPINRGVRADFLPEREPIAGQCVHSLRIHPQHPSRLYQQNHCGTYRTDDRGDSWLEVSEGLPSDFGYVLGLDAGDPDRVWVIPETSSHMRSVCQARLRVYETGDAGATWTPRTEGLPQEHAYVSILREAMATDGLSPCGVYFGTSTGQLYASADGQSWTCVAGHLPKILSVTAAVFD